MKLSIVIPAFNERERITATLEDYTHFFTPLYDEAYELIVVINGSTDGCEELVRSYAKSSPQVHCIVETGKIGKGGAIMVGFKAALGDLVGFVDADGSTPPASFQDLVEHVDEAGLVLASRWLTESVVEPKQPFARRVSSRIFNKLVRLIFGMKLTDTQCGAKLLRKEVLIKVLPHLGITRWAFDVDLLFQVQRAGYALVERPTVWRDSAGSKLNIRRASIEMLLAIIRLRLIYSPFRFVVTLYDWLIGRYIH